MRSSLFALILLGLLCACQSAQKATPANESAKAQSAATPSPEPENKSTPLTTVTQVADDLIVPVQIAKGDTDNANDDYELRIEYPQLKSPTTRQEKQFNQYIKRLVSKEVRDFEAFCRADKRKRKKPLGFSLGLRYSATIISKKLLCLNLRWASYTGYLNSDYYTTTINYDLEKGRELRLADLFKLKSNYLGGMSQVGLKVLKKTCLMCGCAPGVSAGDRLPDGMEYPDDFPAGFKPIKEAVAPKLENFDLWSLTDKGIEITFDEYEIAPGCGGIISILLPLEELKPALREDILVNKL